MTATQLKSGTLREWHLELFEFYLVNPTATLAEAAQYFSVSPSWISIVKNTDAYKEYAQKKRDEHFGVVSTGVADKLTALAEVSLEGLTNRVEAELSAKTASIDMLKETSEMALKSLGFGAGRGRPSLGAQEASSSQHAQNITNVYIDKDTLARAREARARISDSYVPPMKELTLDNLESIPKEKFIDGEK